MRTVNFITVKYYSKKSTRIQPNPRLFTKKLQYNAKSNHLGRNQGDFQSVEIFRFRHLWDYFRFLRNSTTPPKAAKIRRAAPPITNPKRSGAFSFSDGKTVVFAVYTVDIPPAEVTVNCTSWEKSLTDAGKLRVCGIQRAACLVIKHGLVDGENILICKALERILSERIICFGFRQNIRMEEKSLPFAVPQA